MAGINAVACDSDDGVAAGRGRAMNVDNARRAPVDVEECYTYTAACAAGRGRGRGSAPSSMYVVRAPARSVSRAFTVGRWRPNFPRPAVGVGTAVVGVGIAAGATGVVAVAARDDGGV